MKNFLRQEGEMKEVQDDIYSLTNELTPFLDPHMVFPLMEFFAEKGIYDEEDLFKARQKFLSHTNMINYAIEIYNERYPNEDIPTQLSEKKDTVLKKMDELKDKVEPIINIFQLQEVQEILESSRDQQSLMTYLVEKHDFRPDMLDTFYEFSKFQYECGNYAKVADYLYLYRTIAPVTDKNFMNSIWGKLACEILFQNWENALKDVNMLKEAIDTGLGSSPLQVLQQRTWLIHWSLFLFFNHPNGRDLMIDVCLYQPAYLNTIQTMCPHILRYLATAVVINKNSRRQCMRDLVRVIQQEIYSYSDPITEFIAHLYVDFDFDAAQEKLKQCITVVKNDFFTVSCLEDFIENARLMIFELFCRIHQCISIDMLADKLNMTPEEAERWIVNLIRQAKLDAKIDSKEGHVVMDTQAVSPYQQLIDKTKNLSFRTQILALNAGKKATARNPTEPAWINQE